jgi:hypothetical protein
MEFPWALGPEDGRYVLRRHAGEDPDHVLVLRTLGAPERRRLRGRRPRKVEPEPDPTPVVTSRATIIDALPLAGADAAAAWLERADGEALAEEAVRRLNRIVHLHRVAVAQPEVRDVGRDQALAVRVGYGAGDEVAEGRYAAAVELPALRGAHARRTAVLRPQERLAALLSGRDVALACEEFVLRVRGDLAAGRSREAALGLRPALEAAVAELEPWAERGDLRRRLDELTRLRAEAVGTYDRALEGGLDEEETARVERVLGRVEAALRARTAGGIE